VFIAALSFIALRLKVAFAIGAAWRWDHWDTNAAMSKENPDVTQEKKPVMLAGKTGLQKSWALFWLFIKVNVLTTSGPALLAYYIKNRSVS